MYLFGLLYLPLFLKYNTLSFALYRPNTQKDRKDILEYLPDCTLESSQYSIGKVE